jgi:polar amino acid transport system substrate-binding protein
MNMRRLSSYVLLSILLVFISLPAFTQQVLSSIVKKGEIRIGMTGNQPPFTMKSKSGELIGYEVDLAKALAKNMGVELKLVEMPFSDLMGALKAGKIDGVMSGMTMTPERNLDALFAGPYILSGKSILTKSNKVAEIGANATSDKKFKIITLKGSTSEQFVKNYMPKHELILVDNYNKGVDMILTDQADAMVADKPICVITILKNQGKDLVTTEEPLTIEPIGMALPAGDPQFLNLVVNYLASLQLSGTLPMLEKTWFNDGAWMLNVE